MPPPHSPDAPRGVWRTDTYGVLKARPLRVKPNTRGHFQILAVDNGGEHFRVPVNVRSSDPVDVNGQRVGNDLQYVLLSDFRHPITDALRALPDTFTPLRHENGEPSLDYVRGNLFDLTQMRVIPTQMQGDDNDLNDLLNLYVSKAIREAGSMIYAFGAQWPRQDDDPPGRRDFPEVRIHTGVHEIHMNQGSEGQFKKDNAVWHDGGLLLQYPGQGRWVAVFLKFQSQAIHTDPRTGDRLVGQPEPLAPDTGPVFRVPQPDNTEVPDGTVRIIAALVNAVGPAPEAESVTLLNTTEAAIDLTGWHLRDRQMQVQPLAGQIGAGEARRVAIVAPVQLGNGGGTITVLDAHQLRVDGVAYVREQVRDEGRTLVFGRR